MKASRRAKLLGQVEAKPKAEMCVAHLSLFFGSRHMSMHVCFWQVKAEAKAEQHGPTAEPDQSGLQDSGLVQMSHQMLQLLERLNKDAS